MSHQPQDSKAKTSLRRPDPSRFLMQPTGWTLLERSESSWYVQTWLNDRALSDLVEKMYIDNCKKWIKNLIILYALWPEILTMLHE